MFQRILVPVDGSDTSDRGLDAAIALAKLFDSRIRIVHVLDEAASFAGVDPHGASGGDLLPVMREAGEKILRAGKTVANDARVEADTMLFDKFGERLGETVAQAAKLWNAALVVVGTHGRRGLARVLLGSGAEQIIRLAPVPVLTIRGNEGSTQAGSAS